MTVTGFALARPPLGSWNRVALLGAVVAFLVVAFEVVPRFDEVVSSAREWQRLRGQIAEAEGASAERVALDAENRRLERELDELLVSLPRRDQLSAVLGELQRHAADTGVTLQRIEPGEPVPERTHEVLPISVDVEGPFHALGRFVDRVERSPLLMRVRALDIRAQRGTRGTVEAIIELESVRLGADTETEGRRAWEDNER